MFGCASLFIDLFKYLVLESCWWHSVAVSLQQASTPQVSCSCCPNSSCSSPIRHRQNPRPHLTSFAFRRCCFILWLLLPSRLFHTDVRSFCQGQQISRRRVLLHTSLVCLRGESWLARTHLQQMYICSHVSHFRGSGSWLVCGISVRGACMTKLGSQRRHRSSHGCSLIYYDTHLTNDCSVFFIYQGVVTDDRVLAKWRNKLSLHHIVSLAGPFQSDCRQALLERETQGVVFSCTSIADLGIV